MPWVLQTSIASEQVIRGALAARREKKGLQLRLWDLNTDLHRKSRRKMLIGRDDISNDVLHIRARFRFALIGLNLTAQSTGSHRRIGGGVQIPET